MCFSHSENLGEVVVYQWIEWIKDYITSKAEELQGAAHASYPGSRWAPGYEARCSPCQFPATFPRHIPRPFPGHFPFSRPSNPQANVPCNSLGHSPDQSSSQYSLQFPRPFSRPSNPQANVPCNSLGHSISAYNVLITYHEN